MNSNAVCIDAWNAAWPLWQESVRHGGWHPLLVAALQASCGGLCWAVHRRERSAAEGSSLWLLGALVLVALAASTLLALDVLLIHLMRALACEHGWYGVRREVQAGALLALALLGWACLGPLWRGLSSGGAALRCLWAGLAMLLVMAALRAVSLHATDLVLHSRWAGISIGRIGDGLGLLGVGLGVFLALRTDGL